MGLAINASMPTSNVYLTLPSIYNFDNVSAGGQQRQTGAFANYMGVVDSLAAGANVEIYQANVMPLTHILSVVSTDQTSRTQQTIIFRFRNVDLDYGYSLGPVISSVNLSISIVTNNATLDQAVRINNTAAVTKTYVYSIISFTG